MKYFGYLFLFLFPLTGISQIGYTQLETYPTFPECTNAGFPAAESCFNNTLKQFILENFTLPAKVTEENYRGEIMVLFEVDREGKFQVLYVDAIYPELKEEITRVISLLPVITPASYNSRPTYAQFRMPLKIPLAAFTAQSIEEIITEEIPVAQEQQLQQLPAADEYDAIVTRPFSNREFDSNINIPLSHERYSRFDASMNMIGTNSHTASKPFLFKDVARYY